jgi:DNA-binding phage protein
MGPKNPKIWKIRKDAEIYPLELSKDLTDEKLIARAFWECLRDNDPEGAMEIIAIYVREVNKLKYSKEKNISRSTLYRSLRRKNLTIKTVARILHGLS